MTTVDNRAVELGFDNKQFESGVKQSTSSLDALKKSLNFDQTSKSLLNLNSAAKGFNLSNIADGVQHVSSRFSALGIIGMTVLQNLTTAAMQYGKKIVDGLLKPMNEGLKEYETQMNAVQTIMANTASKGTTLKDVNAALDELNTYSDKTIYNFTEMARNIGTFTAAGVGLDQSVESIKGIANLAAVSGSNSQQAATAMYQLSQAISSGTVRLMDWNSVVNAGMGGEVFQNALKETARVHGIAVDEMITDNGSFRESLQEGWLTTQVLTETLAKFTGDLSAEQLRSIGYTESQITEIMKLGVVASDAATKIKTLTQLKETIQESLVSGWAESWRIVIGDFEEAKAFFTEIGDTIGPMIQSSSAARNKILQTWKDIGGREIFIDALRNSFEALLAIAAPIKEAFTDIFPSLRGQDLLRLTKIFRNFTEGLIISGETADKIKRIFKGLFAGFDIAKDIVVALATGVWDLVKSLLPAGTGVLDFLAGLGDKMVEIHDVINIWDIFDTAMQTIGTTADTVKSKVFGFIDTVKSKFEEFKGLFSGIFDNVDTSAIDGLFDKMNFRFKPLTALFTGVGKVLGGFANLAKKIAPTFFKLASAIGTFFLNLGSSIIDSIVKADFSKIFDLINSGLIAGILLAIRNFITSGSGFIDQAGGVFGDISGILDGVRGSLQAWQQNLKANTLLTIAGAIGVLTLSLLVLSGIDSAKLTVSLGAVTAMMLQLMGSMAVFSKVSGTGLGALSASAGLVALSVSIMIMSAALSKLGKLDAEELNRGLGAITALSIGMVILSRVMSQNTGSILKGSVGLIAFGLALLVLTSSVAKLGALDPAELTNGLIGVGVMLAEIAAFMKLVDLDKMGITKGIGLALLAGSIMLMSESVGKFAEMDQAKLQQGLIALGAVLLELALFTQLSSGGAGLIATGIAMVIIAGAIMLLVDSITKLGALDPTQIGRGLFTMGAALLIIVAAMNLMPKNMIITSLGLVAVAGAILLLSDSLASMGGMTWEEIGKGLAALAGSLLILTVALYAMSGTLAGSAALLIAAGALAVLAPVLSTLGAMGIAEIGIALLALAGVFALLAIAGYLLTPVIPTLLGLGVSMMLIGVAAMLVGAGLLAFSMGLAAIAVSGAAAAVAIVAMISTILGIIPLVIKTLIDTIIIFGEGIVAAAPVVAAAITALLMGVLDIIIKVTPKLLQALTILLKGLIQLIVDVVPDFVSAVITLLTTLLEEIAANIPAFVQAGFDILIGFLEGIRDNIYEVVTVATEIITEFLGGISDNVGDVIQAGVDLIIDFINGMADAIDNNTEPLLAALGRLGESIITALVTAISNGAKAVLTALSSIVTAAINAIKEQLGINSPSKVFMEIGESIPEGFAKGILHLKNRVTEAVHKLEKRAVDAMGPAIATITEALSGNIDSNPVIRPVVDLTDVISGKKSIEELISGNYINLASPVDISRNISTGLRPIDISPEKLAAAGNVVNYTQNNYSPKSLSRLEIYRQTRNQLMALKGLV